MAIRLKVNEDSIRLKVSDDTFSFKTQEGIPIYPSNYSGAYSVIPSTETQTLNTRGLMMTDNVTIDPIPNNYGLITWNGSFLTVS